MEEKIKEFLAELRPEMDFETSEDFIEDGLIDSLDIVALMDFVEEEFGIVIPGTEIVATHFKSYATIVEIINKYKK